MKNILLYAIIGLMLLIVGQGAYISVLKNKISSTTSEYNEKLAKKEAAWQQAVYDTTYDIVLKRRLREKELEEVISNLRKRPTDPTVKYVVRDRFSCPPTPSPQSGDDAGAGAGLLQQDVEFLLREARRADRVVEQLQMCQEYVRIVNDGLYTRQK